jgi:PAS domain S-box-containing protein
MSNETPLYNSRIIKIFVEYVKEYYPEINIDSLVEDAGMTIHEAEDPAHWFNQEQVDRFNEILVGATGNPSVAREAGRHAASTGGIGPAKQFTLGLVSLASIYMLMGRVYALVSRGADVETRRLGSNKVEVTSTPRPGVNERPYQCENRIGVFESLARLFTDRLARVEHPSCYHKGDPKCRYVVTWQKSPAFLLKRFRRYFVLSSALAIIGASLFVPSIDLAILFLTCGFATVSFALFVEHLEKRELTKTIEIQGDAAENHLEEINIRYNNALLVQEIGQATSTFLDIDKLLEAVVRVMEKRLDFERGIIMLTDPKRSMLFYRAGYGYTDNDKEILQKTGFHLGKSESRGIFVLAYKEQRPFLIDDITTIETGISKRSLELAKRMGVQSLICVPIVYEKNSLGILAVDNVSSKRALTQSDMSLLMGVASQTAVSIINARSFQKVQVSEKKYRDLVENANSIILRMDIHGNITFFNEFAQRFFGFSEEVILGKNVEGTILPRGTATKRDLERLIGSLQQDPEQQGVIESENVLRKGNPVWIAWTYKPIFDEEGDFNEILCIGSDVSKRKIAEDALRESEKRYRKLYAESKRAEELYRSVLHSSADAIVISDLDGNTHYLSPAFERIFGWTMAELEGKPIPNIPKSETEQAMLSVERILRIGEPIQDFETKLYAKDGRLFDVSISASRYCDDEGNPAGMLMMLRDISEKKRLEAQLLQAHKMEAIGTLAGGIAHDFNNILQAISGYTQIILMGKDRSDPDYEKLYAIERSAQRASDLTKRLLIFGRKLESQLKPVSLNQEVTQVAKMLDRTIPKMIEIECRLAEDIGIIDADPVQIEQILMNLGINARDAMPEGGKLVFRTESVTLDDDYCKSHLGCTPGNYVRLSVSDTGQGIEKEVVEHIFEPFFTTKETGKGTGLGLAMVYGIVQSHGGYMTVNSKPGQGVTFDIYFPVREVEREGPVLERVHSFKRGDGETILLVDDEESIRELGQEVLSRFGYRVLTAPDGESALELFEKEPKAVDLVILDFIMPGMGGDKCLRGLLQLNPEAKVLMASGYSVNDAAKEAIEAGAKGFVAKPYQVKEMLGVVREVLEGESKAESHRLDASL